MKKPVWGIVALLALVATLGAGARLPKATPATSGIAFSQPRPAGKQLPAGFVLPSSDVDLRISSLVAADLDADGDLDIVAAGSAGSPFGIVVWVNDGDGRLTRKFPEPSSTFQADPAAPSVDQQRATVVASIQPECPAVQPSSDEHRLTLREARWHARRPPCTISATTSSIRTRAPPAVS